MTSFQTIKTKVKIDGFICHHVIPRQVTGNRVFAKFFGQLRSEGFDPENFVKNGMHLPSTEVMAETFGLPLHRGPHPRYNDMVATHIAVIEHLKPRDALVLIAQLQSQLRVSLRFFGAANLTIDRTPMTLNLDADFELIGRLAIERHAIPRIRWFCTTPRFGTAVCMMVIS
jgi:hypothetical protein